MKPKTNDAIYDLKILIDISCMSLENLGLFEPFHKLVIAIACKATDISIDYRRRRIHMYVQGEDLPGEYLTRFDQMLTATMPVNIGYTKMGDFLKSCTVEEKEDLQKCYPLLRSQFIKSNYQASLPELLTL